MNKIIQTDHDNRIINIGLVPDNVFKENSHGFIVDSFPDGQYED